MRFAGIDIGSRTIELVVTDDAGEITADFQADTGFDPAAEAKKLVDGIRCDQIMATGYGRNLFEISFEAPTVTEIKAHARGARAFFPDTRTVLDIGGQDSKAISLFENGRVKKFEMNDRCAAGKGVDSRKPAIHWRTWGGAAGTGVGAIIQGSDMCIFSRKSSRCHWMSRICRKDFPTALS